MMTITKPILSWAAKGCTSTHVADAGVHILPRHGTLAHGVLSYVCMKQSLSPHRSFAM